MTNRSFNINIDSTNSTRKDALYKSFLCALLVFLAMCLIILLISFSGKYRTSIRKSSKREDTFKTNILSEKLWGIATSTNKYADVDFITNSEIFSSNSSQNAKIIISEDVTTTKMTSEIIIKGDLESTRTTEVNSDFIVSSEWPIKVDVSTNLTTSESPGIPKTDRVSIATSKIFEVNSVESFEDDVISRSTIKTVEKNLEDYNKSKITPEESTEADGVLSSNSEISSFETTSGKSSEDDIVSERINLEIITKKSTDVGEVSDSATKILEVNSENTIFSSILKESTDDKDSRITSEKINFETISKELIETDEIPSSTFLTVVSSENTIFESTSVKSIEYDIFSNSTSEKFSFESTSKGSTEVDELSSSTNKIFEVTSENTGFESTSEESTEDDKVLSSTNKIFEVTSENTSFESTSVESTEDDIVSSTTSKEMNFERTSKKSTERDEVLSSTSKIFEVTPEATISESTSEEYLTIDEATSKTVIIPQNENVEVVLESVDDNIVSNDITETAEAITEGVSFEITSKGTMEADAELIGTNQVTTEEEINIVA